MRVCQVVYRAEVWCIQWKSQNGGYVVDCWVQQWIWGCWGRMGTGQCAPCALENIVWAIFESWLVASAAVGGLRWCGHFASSVKWSFVEFYSQKRKILVFSCPEGDFGVNSNVHNSSFIRWKAHGRLSISDNWAFFTSSHTVRILLIWQTVVVKRHLWTQYLKSGSLLTVAVRLLAVTHPYVR